ncbi:GTP-binding protein [Streptomyces albus subsp. albus]|nr:GTP-binding protein [Streptomyces albus subsp. albus]
MRTLNIGILAHVDAGKTSLTERLLFETGAIDRPGSVDASDTRTDTGAIERERGITIRAAVVSFRLGDTQVNLIDTPGHSDFIAEVERALGVLDGAVLVLSAVEGVQAQTRALMKTLHALRLPTLLFINKIDRAGARPAELLADIRRLLAPLVVPMTGVRAPGTAGARAEPRSIAGDAGFRTELAEALAEVDTGLLARVVDGSYPDAAELGAALAERTAQGLVHPVFCGSAISGEGVAALAEGITRLLPPGAGGAGRGAPRGTVFALERGPSGEKTAWLRLFAGELAPRQRVTFHRQGYDGTAGEHTGQITALRVIGPDDGRGTGGETGIRAAGRLTAGGIGVIRGLPGIRVGDRLGADPVHPDRPRPRLAPPTLSTVVRPRDPDPGAAARLHTALLALAERDPLMHARTEPDGATSVLLYGEVQKEIIAATLARDFGLAAVFEPSRTVFLERPVGTGEALEEIEGRKHIGYWATVGLRVAPAPRGTGAVFDYETELGALPRAFHTAIEESVYAALRSGPHGWAVTDCRVTLVRSGFVGPKSTAGDFRAQTPVVLRRALEQAGTLVYEPYHAFELEVPADCLSAATGRLAALGAEVNGTAEVPAGWQLRGELPARRTQPFQRQLPGITHGEGVWWTRPAPDRPVPSTLLARQCRKVHQSRTHPH